MKSVLIQELKATTERINADSQKREEILSIIKDYENLKGKWVCNGQMSYVYVQDVHSDPNLPYFGDSKCQYINLKHGIYLREVRTIEEFSDYEVVTDTGTIQILNELMRILARLSILSDAGGNTYVKIASKEEWQWRLL